MRPKSILTAGLLAFVAASVAVLAIDAVKGKAGEDASAPATQAAVLVQYFHVTARCETCNNMENYARDALQTAFPDEWRDARIQWRSLDYTEPRNEDLAARYHLDCNSLVVSSLRGGVEVGWKKLDRIWDLVGDRAAYERYVQDEVRACLEAY
ncbi:MAG: nitrophenyl compound nitroreductase subunit ArsF family protein [Candidatus Sumerlaeota bacterium]|nr:nitrophenyl compound nitroreductase subunit ArsF family protein [Candidatus Sumerlaeota bacterium]